MSTDPCICKSRSRPARLSHAKNKKKIILRGRTAWHPLDFPALNQIVHQPQWILSNKRVLTSRLMYLKQLGEQQLYCSSPITSPPFRVEIDCFLAFTPNHYYLLSHISCAAYTLFFQHVAPNPLLFFPKSMAQQTKSRRKKIFGKKIGF